MGAITVTKPARPQPVPSGCWAASLGDCSKKMSREHTVSRSLFATDEVMVQGFPWCANEPKKIGVGKPRCKNSL